MSKVKPISRYTSSYLQRRYGSSMVLNLSQNSTTLQVKSVQPTNVEKISKVSEMMRESPSTTFLETLGDYRVPETYDTGPESPSRNHLVKKRIYEMFKAREYDSLVEFFLHFTANSLDQLKKEEPISFAELSYYIRQLIEHQVKLVHVAANSKATSKNATLSRRKLSEANYFRVKIRKIYENILYGNSKESIYDRSKRSDLYNSTNLTGHKLSIADYENLIYMELRNHKLDLASKWFTRMEQQFENHEELMTRSMWIMKLQTYSGGLPSTWKTESNKIPGGFYNPSKSKFKAYIPFTKILTRFFDAQNRTSDGKMSIDIELGETLIYCIGHSKKSGMLENFIENLWGISSTGKTVESFKFPTDNDPSYPDINILKALVIAFSHSGEFFKAMKYVNSFQEVYSIGLSSPKSKNFWEHLFRMCDQNTAFSEENALHYFLQNTSPRGFDQNKSLKEIQKNADFDYEGFLTYVNDLKAQRVTTFSELWSLFQQENGFYSPKIISTFISFLGEQLEPLESLEPKYYQLLRYLDLQHALYHVSNDSFNRTTLNAIKNTSDSVDFLYESALRDFIDYKLKATLRGQCQPLIDEWSLDEAMNIRLTNWFRTDRIPKYINMIEKKREEVMISMKTEENDSFLGLM